MYLALLTEREKIVFLGMAYNIATIDGDYSDAEKAMINGYCHELQCQFDENTMIKPMESLIQAIKVNSSEKTKKIFVFELIGLSLADVNYGSDERKLISQMLTEYNIDSDFANKCESMVSEYIGFQGRINKLILG
ncbi:hypothetical protein [Peptostreptococcus porci]|uniref:hypothetical protein n=1 Tax=Peptostreptococcus porci TaxID=2652282 RepID=UPI002A90D602|nr:hypothetical protein [Peptostreptococcus porci]MDY6232139.1 hypothetical protein [Peptostreptococcus porci]